MPLKNDVFCLFRRGGGEWFEFIKRQCLFSLFKLVISQWPQRLLNLTSRISFFFSSISDHKTMQKSQLWIFIILIYCFILSLINALIYIGLYIDYFAWYVMSIVAIILILTTIGFFGCCSSWCCDSSLPPALTSARTLPDLGKDIQENG